MGAGRAKRLMAVGIGLAALAATGLGPERAKAQETETEPPALITLGATSLRPTIAPECAGRTDVLGVARVVEIDTSAGPRFGQQYKGVEDDFLNFGEVVLTFDDGPMKRHTIPILDALDEQCTKATFFAVGRMAASDPATLQEVARRGHTIGTHTWSHKNLATLGADAMKREVELGISAVAAAAEEPISPFFRFPYLGHGRASLAYVESRGLGIFGIHVDSRDFRTRNPSVMQRTLLNQLERDGKGILLFHDIQVSTARGIRELLAELKTRGFRVVHIVPSKPATTLPEFDAIAAKSIKGRKGATAKAPLVDRSVTWPVAGEERQAPAAAPPAPPAERKAAPAPKKDWSNPTNDPWQLRTMGH